MAGYLNRMNRVRVTPELLAEVMQMHATMPAEDRGDLAARSCRVFALLDERVARDQLGPLTAAIDFRLTALARLIDEQGGRGFTLPGDEQGLQMIHPDLVRCAAEEPLIEQDNHLAFDVKSFQRRLLSVTKPHGQA